MAHKTFEQLQTEINTAANLIEAGAEYTHYKDVSNRYRVTGFGILETTDEVAVKYSPVLSPHIEFIRPVQSWITTVEWEGAVVTRFKKA